MEIKPKRLTQGLVLSSAFIANISSSSLLDLRDSYASELEVAAAAANQATYDALLSQGCFDQQIADAEGCSGDVFATFKVVRELVHNANELTGEGPTQFSLQLDVEDLGFALRWTAAEELTAQSDLSTEFVEGQLSSLASRITALRFGARGFQVSGLPYSSPQIANHEGAFGGAAGVDGFSRLSGFLNASYTYGTQDPTDFEDAFDFDGVQINGGLDYRLNDNWVLGATLGFSDQTVEFDATRSIVNGEITSDGFSIMPFVLYSSDSLFWGFSLGLQQMTLDADRGVRYTSLNPDVASTDTRAVSSTDASTTSLYSNLGYSARAGAFTIEPYAELRYMDITIDAFTERDINGGAQNFNVAEQSITSNEVAVGLNIQYVWTPSFAVVIPYFDMQLRNELDDETGVVSASYADANTGASFNLSANEVDTQYMVYTVGVSSVVRGGRQTTADGPSGGGISLFLNYKTFTGIENFSQDVIAGGIRYEF